MNTEEKIKELEDRIKLLEKRPQFVNVPVPYPVYPQPICPQTPYWQIPPVVNYYTTC